MAIFNNDNKQFEFFIADVKKICENLKSNAKKEDIDEIEKFIHNFKLKTDDFYRNDRRLNIGVVGQVKAGKSSFLNTLLFDGKEIFMVDTDRARGRARPADEISRGRIP